MTAALELLPTPALTIDAVGVISEGNTRACRLLLRSLVGQRIESLVIPIDVDVVRRALASTATVERLFVHCLRADGEVIAADLAIGPPCARHGLRIVQIHDARERIASEREYERRAGTLAFIAELSEQFAAGQSAPEAFDQALVLLREYIPQTGAAVARVDESGRVLGLVGARGVAPTALAALLDLRLDPRGSLPPEDLSRLREAIAESATVELVPLSSAGQLVGVALFAFSTPPSDHVHALTRLAAKTFAVALRAADAAESVRALDAERRQLLDAIPLWVYRFEEPAFDTTFVNGAVARAVGRSEAAILRDGGLLSLLADERERAALEQAKQTALSNGESSWIDLRFRGAHHRVRVLRTRLYRVSDARRGGWIVEGIGQDVTDELETRTQLVHNDRLASLGALAAGVAHEINNPAAFIMLGIQQLSRLVEQLQGDEREGPSRARMAEILADLHDGVQRIAQIVGELRLFARIPESAVSTPVDVNQLIRSAVTLTQSLVKARARVELDLGPLPALPGDHARLGQVFVNLLVNAAQAIPPGASEVHVVRVETREQSGSVIVRVSDSGVGIRDEDLPRVFDPFFTTKGPGDGTGLGLTISMDLVRRAGGTIEVQSRLGEGTTFTITLPIRETTTTHHPSQPPLREPPKGGRVLIVEDEQALAIAIARGLSPRFQVDHAADGVRALERLTRADAPLYDSVLCDVRVPGLDGPSLFEAVRAARPALAARFVFLTGGAMHEEHAQFLQRCGRPVLEKPFRIEELDAALAVVVSEESRYT